MRKLKHEELSDAVIVHRRRIHPALTILAGLALMPLFYDVSKVCAAQWQAMYGPIPSIETPAIDSMISKVEDARRSVRGPIHNVFRRLPWEPNWVFAVGFGWVVVGFLLMSRRPT